MMEKYSNYSLIPAYLYIVLRLAHLVSLSLSLSPPYLLGHPHACSIAHSSNHCCHLSTHTHTHIDKKQSTANRETEEKLVECSLVDRMKSLMCCMLVVSAPTHDNKMIKLYHQRIYIIYRKKLLICAVPRFNSTVTLLCILFNSLLFAFAEPWINASVLIFSYSLPEHNTHKNTPQDHSADDINNKEKTLWHKQQAREREREEHNNGLLFSWNYLLIDFVLTWIHICSKCFNVNWALKWVFMFMCAWMFFLKFGNFVLLWISCMSYIVVWFLVSTDFFFGFRFLKDFNEEEFKVLLKN